MSLKRKLARKTYKFRKKLGFTPNIQKSTDIPISGTQDENLVWEEKPSSWEIQVLKDAKQRAKERSNVLKAIFDNTEFIKKDDIILLTMGRDEDSRIPYFLEYYRDLGVNHFLFIDNKSINPMSTILSDMPDVSLWYTEDSYADSKFGVDWMNILLNRYGVGHWCLTVDLDEFFVFPLMESRSFRELLRFLDNNEKTNFFAPMIDMYPKGAIADAVVPTGEPPLKYANYFDRYGYFIQHGGYEDTWIRGGPRYRVFANSDLDQSPTLNKTPLIKWHENYMYVASTHTLVPFHLNHVHGSNITYPTGALLHFKFISNMKEKSEFAVLHNNHYDDSREYRIYLEKLKDEESMSINSSISEKYINSQTLVDWKLMNLGSWGNP